MNPSISNLLRGCRPLLLALGLLALVAAPAPASPPAKKATSSARLVLPYYEVDMAHPQGKGTYFSVRNQTTQPVDVTISYFATDHPQVPQVTPQSLTLAGKQLKSIQIRSVPGLLVDADGFARGYVVIETVTGAPVIQGEYFQLTPDQAFANGSRLVNADPQSTHNDLCSVFTIRFLNGGGFDGGTQLVLWLDTGELPPEGQPTLSYEVYNEAGKLIFGNDLVLNEVSVELNVADLVSLVPTQFGVLELQLNGLSGHISAVMSALGLYSVGFEAACDD